MARPKKKDHPFVSRGGLKLKAAIEAFDINVKGRIVLDVGASTGGFTDCLLQNGAAKVYAVDVGYGILDWKLRKDPRVAVLERTNVRYLDKEKLYGDGREISKQKAEREKQSAENRNQKEENKNLPVGQAGTKEHGYLKADLAVIDVSFISLEKVLPVVYGLLSDKAEVIALIKPQFEAKKEEVERGGIVRNAEVRDKIVEKMKAKAESIGLEAKGVIASPITGADGNVEYLIYLGKL